MDGATVAAALGLEDAYRPWLAELDAAADAAPPLDPRHTAELGDLLRRLGCSEAAAGDAVATLPDPRRDPERWWLLDRCHRRLVSSTGDPAIRCDHWPALPDHLGLAARCFPLHWYAATVPAVCAWHRSRGVPAAISWASLADLGRHEAIHRLVTGMTGVDAPRWLTLHVRGLLFEVGPLQYEPINLGPGVPQPWYGDSDAHRRGPGFGAGDPSVAIHIPSGARLDPAACGESMCDAAALLDEVLPSPGRRVLTCSTWLLDDQWSEYLPPSSNILGFQRRFELVPGWEDADEIVLAFAFAKRGLPVEPASATTRLQQATLHHLAAGRHLRWRTGWCEP